MEIYHKGKLVKKMQRFFVKKDKSFFLALRGINFEGSGEDIFVDEIYMPLFTFSFQGKMIFIDIAKRSGGFLTVILFSAFPFIYIGHGDASFKEDE